MQEHTADSDNDERSERARFLWSKPDAPPDYYSHAEEDHLKRNPHIIAASRRYDAVLRREGVPRTIEQLFKPSLALMGLGIWYCEAVLDRSDDERPAYATGCRRTDHVIAGLLHTDPDEPWDRTHLVLGFAAAWAVNGFPVIRVGAKQAAAMMLTDAPQIAPPWEACAICVPDGLLELGAVPIRYLLCLENHCRMAAIGPDGMIDRPSDEEHERKTLEMADCLTRSLYAAIEANTHVTTERYRGKGRTKNRGYREAPPPGTAYVVKAPVSIDLRKTVREITTGTHRGRRPKVQFVVRGHWRNQPHGPRMELRRWQWIEPYWKGPKDAVAAIKAYRVE